MTEEGPEGPPPDLASHGPAGPVDVVTGLGKAYKGVLVGAGIVVLFILFLLWGANRPVNPTFADSATSKTTASGPTFAEKKIGVGASCLKVLVADTPEKRAEGLRNRNDLGRDDGMVFEFGQTMDHTKTRFTMSDVKFPLTIGFYDQSGLRVDAVDMAPCTGTDSTCPVYSSKTNFNTAIETAQGKLPDGPLTACPGGA
ncbi:MAG TPA: DUF192 domain-containing protein [Acidimicrobiia bacterium]|nr:DUF192 domain-containing protein [Acidimicrobiia bacterium]